MKKQRKEPVFKNQIQEVSKQRDNYIATEKLKSAANSLNTATLETEVEKIIKTQVQRFHMKIE